MSRASCSDTFSNVLIHGVNLDGRSLTGDYSKATSTPCSCIPPATLQANFCENFLAIATASARGPRF